MTSSPGLPQSLRLGQRECLELFGDGVDRVDRVGGIHRLDLGFWGVGCTHWAFFRDLEGIGHVGDAGAHELGPVVARKVVCDARLDVPICILKRIFGGEINKQCRDDSTGHHLPQPT